jgi:uncharacterized protein
MSPNQETEQNHMEYSAAVAETERAVVVKPRRSTVISGVKLNQLERACRVFFLEYGPKNDPAHDLGHVTRVNENQKLIARHEGGDQLILVPAALLHDVVNYPKNTSQAVHSAHESAELAVRLLEKLSWYPRAKIAAVAEAIRTHSFSSSLSATSFEGAILRDADLLEATGVIGLMRTFASCGVYGRNLFHPDDPFCSKRSPNPASFGFDLFYARLLKVPERLHTNTARRIAHSRHRSLQIFLESWKKERLLTEQFNTY